ncbi:MAG: Ppx/GppA phosphatase family protein [Bacteroidota bacterium]|nr:Ppx/GppA phosphatase family protein [Bacteroidota bacterium]
MDSDRRAEVHMRIASVDIGTNAILLLIADIDNTGNIQTIEHQQRFPRLGKEVNDKYLISTTAFKGVTKVLNEYKTLAEKFKADIITACATSAVRDSLNKYEFITHLKKTTGINIDIISGEDEALLTFKGAVSGLQKGNYQPMVVDIGGGSTELSFYEDDAFISYSFQIGAVRLTEHFLNHNPPTNEEIETVRKAIDNKFRKIKQNNLSSYSLVGVAGTTTTLACLDQNLMEFDVKRVSGYKLTYESVDGWFNKLIRLSSSQIRSLSNTTEGRADILPAGVLILWNFMKQFNFKEILVSERGLRYGLALREWEKKLKA